MELAIKQVGKLYGGKVWGLKDFSLEIGPGVLGLVGPNGAGKSTLMRILATVTKPTTGRVTWNGIDIWKAPDRLRAVLGYLPQDFGVYPHLNAYEFLAYLAALKGLDGRAAGRRIELLIELVGLRETAKRPLGSYSGGMKQRVGIAQALLNDPQVLIVDEPTSGLDPGERVRFRNLISDLAGERIVVLSTHIAYDVEAAATEVAILNHGRLLVHCLPEELIRSVENKVWSWVVSSAEMHAARQDYLLSGAVRRADGVYLRVVADSPPADEAKPLSATLEDAYLYTIYLNHLNRSDEDLSHPLSSDPS
jgi:ABC-2 type transport system ATP-binding protein